MAAFRKFNKRDQLSKFDQEAQKLSQYIENLAENEDAQERWIWELIQNAKDTNNELEATTIRITIDDDKLTFSHNADPFTPEQLNSITSQYSLKQDLNSEEVETTGKYGTGFISTHILSRIIRIEGKLKVVEEDDQEDSDEEVDNEEDEGDHGSEKQDQPDNRSSKRLNKAQLKEAKANAKVISDGYYQSFSIVLDRTFKTRQQLAKKLMRTKKEIEKQLNNNKNRSPLNERTESDFDTSFVYEKLDTIAPRVIEKGIKSLRRLLPSVFLFNNKLHSVEVYNNSKNKQLKGFTITRGQTQKLNLLFMFNVIIEEESGKNHHKKKSNPHVSVESFVYSKDPNTKSMIAIPVQITPERKIIVKKLEGGHPKIYKEFPLIGSEDTKFNFIFTSRQFYPNETRSQLLLKTIAGRPSSKVERNWQILHSIFDNIKDLYILIHKYVIGGKFNLFMIPSSNCFTEHFHDRSMQAKFILMEKQFHKFQIFKLNNGKTLSIEKALIFYQQALNMEKDQDINGIRQVQFHQLFSFLFDNQTLSDDDYQEFLEFNHFHPEKRNLFKIKNLDYALKELSNLSFKDVASKLGGEDRALDHLLKIYKFLLGHKSLRKHYLLTSRYKIILTEDYEWRSFKVKSKVDLKVKENYANMKFYESIAIALSIAYKAGLINGHFAELFTQIAEEQIKRQIAVSQTKSQSDQSENHAIRQKYIYGFSGMMEHYRIYFKESLDNILPKGFDNRCQKLQVLGSFLASFSNPKPIDFQNARFFTNLERISVSLITDPPAKMKVAQFKYFQEEFKNRFLDLLVEEFNTKNTLGQFSLLFKQKFRKDEIVIKFINYLIKNRAATLTKMVVWNRKIVNLSNTTYLLSKDYYPNNDDLVMQTKYLLRHNIHLYSNLQNITEQVVHPWLQLTQDLKKRINLKRFSDYFYFLVSFYNDSRTSDPEKQDILNYFCKIYEEYSKNQASEMLKCKYQTFESIIAKRHSQYAQLLRSLTNKQKDLICKFFRMRDRFSDFETLLQDSSINEVIAMLREMKRQEEAQMEVNVEEKQKAPQNKKK